MIVLENVPAAGYLCASACVGVVATFLFSFVASYLMMLYDDRRAKRERIDKLQTLIDDHMRGKHE
jgi:hypothetical protein